MSDTRELTFSIAAVFDPSDELARWLTVLAMASNDFWRFFAWMDNATDEPTRILAFRLEAAALHEAARHLTKPPTRWPRIASFLAALPEVAQADRDRVCGAIDPQSEHYLGDWLTRHRNVTFHYADVHPDRSQAKQEEIELALTRAIEQGIEGKIVIANENFGEVRFEFADEAAVQWLPDADTDEGVGQIQALRDTCVALARFAQRAIGAHLAALPDGVVAGLP